MSSQPPSNDIFLVNPYQSHPSLTPLEADVLWEYAKLAQNLQMVSQKIRLLHQEPDKHMLAKLRILEKKMGLVSTLFKASVWAVINEQPEFNDASDATIRH